MSRLTNRLSTLATMSPAQLRDQWATIGGEAAPIVPAGLLRRLLAQRLQEKRFGGLPVSVERELMRVVTGDAFAHCSATVLHPGARLVREWQGRTIVVDVEEDGFVWEGRSYRSLSSIASEVTGAHWSGPRFFGLKPGG